MSDADHKISKAKAMLVLDNPFIASLVCGLKVHVDETIQPPSLQTNGQWIKAHPDWIMSHTTDEVKWALGHEVMHCIFKHFLAERIGQRNPVRWNVAADVIINVLLSKDKVGTRPKGVIWDAHPMLGGKTAQELYEKGQTTEGVYVLLPNDPGGFGGGKSGHLWDQVEPLEGDQSTQTAANAEWDVRVAQAAAAARMAGKLSKDMERFVGEVLRPRINWHDRLREFFVSKAKVDYSYARPNRRFLPQGIYLPGRNGTGMLGKVAIGVDLSGSVSQAELEEFAAELTGIKEDTQPEEMHVIYFASQVLKVDVFSRDDELEIKPFGTGGTAFSPVFRYIDEENIEPICCVMLTDLCASDFGPVPPYPVLWISTLADKAPFGEVVMLRENTGA